MRRGSLLQLLSLTVAAFAIGAVIALVIPWMPSAASKEAGRIWFTYWFATWISLGIFAIVFAVLVYALLKFRVREGDLSDGPPVHGHTKLEIVWTAVPFALVTAISIVSAIVVAQNGHAGRDPLVVKVTAQQFAWKFTYPNGKTYDDALRLPEDRHVKLRITSNDVIHSFWVPQFGQKQDAVPGQVYSLVITPTKVGTYPLICTELCGLGHALMRSRAVVMPAADYDAWYERAGSAAPPAAGGGAGGGAEDAAATFTQNGCGACHVFSAIPGATGKVGPSLDHLKRAAASAGEDDLSAYVKESIVDPNKVVAPGYQPGVMPPNFAQQIPPDKLDALVQYLVEHTK
ncbi:MAG TPA: cytochrome c oxidase subunit II [Gaiellaceae bacterium]|nr:cytochrome c oxidase subunit II [Gaiellaceae bacterium]